MMIFCCFLFLLFFGLKLKSDRRVLAAIYQKNKNKNNRIVFIIYVACTIFLTNNIVQQYTYSFISFSQFSIYRNSTKRAKTNLKSGDYSNQLDIYSSGITEIGRLLNNHSELLPDWRLAWTSNCYELWHLISWHQHWQALLLILLCHLSHKETKTNQITTLRFFK